MLLLKQEQLYRNLFNKNIMRYNKYKNSGFLKLLFIGISKKMAKNNLVFSFSKQRRILFLHSKLVKKKGG